MDQDLPLVSNRGIDNIDRSSMGRDHPIERNFERPGDSRDSLRDDINAAREELEDNEGRMDRDKSDEVRDRERRERRTERRARPQLETSDENESPRGTPEAEGTAEDRTPKASTTNAAPASWTKEARAEWNNAPPRIQQEVLKRERDMENGVKQLRQHYNEIDQALSPYAQTIQQFGKTPGQAVKQMFEWYNSFVSNPDAAFPALMQSYQYSPMRMVANMVRAQPDQFVAALAQHFRMTPQQLLANIQRRVAGQAQRPVDPYTQQLAARLNNFEQAQRAQYQQQVAYYHQQNEKNTRNYLQDWSKSRPHFEETRHLMATYLTPNPDTGQAHIPLTPEGNVDLHSAYVLACKTLGLEPNRSRKAMADRDHATQARRASVSLTNTGPGSNNFDSRAIRKQGKGLSVRDSLKAAIVELSDR